MIVTPKEDGTTARAEARGSDAIDGPALPLPHLRGVAVAVAMAQAAALPACWVAGLATVHADEMVPGFVLPTVVVGIWCALVFAARWKARAPAGRVDVVAAVALAVVPVVAAIALLVRMFAWRSHHQADWREVALGVPVVLLHAASAAVLARALRRRAGVPDAAWTAHGSSEAGRSLAVAGVLMVAGGCAGICAVLPLLLLLGVSGNLEAEDLAYLLALGHGVGSVGGVACTAFAVPLLRNTDLSRTIPRLALPLLPVAAVTGIALPAVFLVLPLLLAGASVALRRRYPIIPPGHCTACRYDLRGIPGSVCPECGAAVESAEVAA